MLRKRINKKQDPIYVKWYRMMHRCYSGREKDRYYKDCSVCEEWHDFRNFEKWFKSQTGNNNKGWHLDKDILLKGNTIYSPDTCAIVPPDVNYFLILRENGRGFLPIGVTKHKDKFAVQISSEGRQRMIGRFDNPNDAFLCYKSAKEFEAKRLAEKYRNIIDERIYNALMKYVVNIQD